MSTDSDVNLPIPVERTEDFYRRVRDSTRRYLSSRLGSVHPYAEYLWLAPDMFHLLCRLVADPAVPAKYKARLAGAIAYFVSPIDIMAEIVLGPVGFLDDVALAAWVLQGMLNEVDPNIVRRHGAGSGDALRVIQRVVGAAGGFLGPSVWQRVKQTAGERSG